MFDVRRWLSVLTSLAVVVFSACEPGASPTPPQTVDQSGTAEPARHGEPGQLPAAATIFTAVGFDGTIVRGRPGQWEEVPTPTSADLNAVWGFDARNLVAVGEGVVLTSDDAGRTWEDVTPSGLRNSELRGVWGTSPDDYWVTAQSGFLLHWNGEIWASIRLPEPLRTVDFRGELRPFDLMAIWGHEGTLYVSGTRDGMIASSSDGGQTWTREAPSNRLRADDPLNDGLAFWDFWSAPSGDLYASGEGSTVLRFDGSEWTDTDAPFPTIHFALWGTGDEHIWAVSRTWISSTEDGGDTWSIDFDPSTPLGTSIRGVWGTSAANIVAVASSGAFYAYDGQAWQEEAFSASSALTDVWGTTRARGRAPATPPGRE